MLFFRHYPARAPILRINFHKACDIIVSARTNQTRKMKYAKLAYFTKKKHVITNAIKKKQLAREEKKRFVNIISLETP